MRLIAIFSLFMVFASPAFAQVNPPAGASGQMDLSSTDESTPSQIHKGVGKVEEGKVKAFVDGLLDGNKPAEIPSGVPQTGVSN